MWPFSRSKQTSVKKKKKTAATGFRPKQKYVDSVFNISGPCAKPRACSCKCKKWVHQLVYCRKETTWLFCWTQLKGLFSAMQQKWYKFQDCFHLYFFFFVSSVLVTIRVLQCCAPRQYTSSCYLNVDIPIGQIPEGVVNVNYNKGCRNTNMIRFRMKPVGVLICGLKQSL